WLMNCAKLNIESVSSCLIKLPKLPEMLTAFEIATLNEIMKMLKSFELVSKEILGQKYITCSKVILIVNVLLHELHTLNPESINYSQKSNQVIEPFGNIDLAFRQYLNLNVIDRNQLGMKKLSARWVPRLLTVDHKRDREFLRRFITVDETWIHYFTPETKEHSEESEDREVGKVQMINYYAALLDFKKKYPHLAKKKVLFHQNNARFHTCPARMTKFNEFRYELLLHPAYSPDLTPCDYFLLPNLKKWFGGKRFFIREQLITKTEAYFEGLNKSYYSDGLKKLENHWIKCIELKGDYVEK
ncbi:SETMR methyltransferase, partial [Acromyrmex heyeri]